jgi:hypothetical protein
VDNALYSLSLLPGSPYGDGCVRGGGGKRLGGGGVRGEMREGRRGRERRVGKKRKNEGGCGGGALI